MRACRALKWVRTTPARRLLSSEGPQNTGSSTWRGEPLDAKAAKEADDEKAVAGIKNYVSFQSKPALEEQDSWAEFRASQLLAEKQRVQRLNAALLAEPAEDHSDLLYLEEDRAAQEFSFDREMANDEDPLPDLSGLPPQPPRKSMPVFDQTGPPVAWDSQVPPTEVKKMTESVAARKERSQVSTEEMERWMAQPLKKPTAAEERQRLDSLNPYMGSYVFDTYGPRYTPWDFIRFTEAQQPWRGSAASNDLPAPVFFTSKTAPPQPAPSFAENFEDDIEKMLQKIAEMPAAPEVMTMGELKSRRLNRGLPWAFMHLDQK
eukprot:EG_transcript_14868